MSDVKITYKPVDKNARLAKIINSIRQEGEDKCGLGTYAWIDTINSIYNTKEEDGEISTISIQHGDIKLEAWLNEVNPCVGIKAKVRIWLACNKPNTMGMCDFFSKQEMRDFAQALLKMAEQI